MLGIDVGGVEQRDAEVDRLVDHLARGFQIGALAEIVAAEPDRGHAQAGAAEIAILHGSILWGVSTKGAAIVARVPLARKVRVLPRLAPGDAAKSLCSKKRCGPGQTRRLI